MKSDENNDQLLVEAKLLVPYLADLYFKTEKSRKMLSEVEKSFRDKGFFKLMQPKHYGGFEKNHLMLIEMAALLAQGCPSSAWVFSNLAIHSSMLGYFDKQAQDDVWGINPNNLICMSVVYSAGKAKIVDGGYVLFGEWPFCSGIDNSQWNIVAAEVINTDHNNANGRRLFLLPQNDYKIIDNWDSFGLSGTGSHNVKVDNVFVPKHRSLAEIDTRNGAAPGTSLNTSPLFRLPMQAISSTAIAGVSLGTAIGALNYFIEVTKKRVSTYSGESVTDLQNLQIHISNSSAKIDTAGLVLRTNTNEALTIAESGYLPSESLKVKWRRDCAFAVRLCNDAITTLFEASGGSALFNKNLMSRYFRDIKAISSHIAYNTDVSGITYGRYRLGLDKNGMDY